MADQQMKYRIVQLGRDYSGKITDFAEARNSFLKVLPDNEYILWESPDEELPTMLLETINELPGIFPYYWIRRINLHDGKYILSWNPEYSPHLVSNSVRYEGRLHEKVVPKNPHGTIDIPIIHNHIGGTSYDSGWKAKPAYRIVLAAKKSFQAMRYGC